MLLLLFLSFFDGAAKCVKDCILPLSLLKMYKKAMFVSFMFKRYKVSCIVLLTWGQNTGRDYVHTCYTHVHNKNESGYQVEVFVKWVLQSIITFVFFSLLGFSLGSVAVLPNGENFLYYLVSYLEFNNSKGFKNGLN